VGVQINPEKRVPNRNLPGVAKMAHPSKHHSAGTDEAPMRDKIPGFRARQMLGVACMRECLHERRDMQRA
jgi:hypothetical protein